MLFDDTINFFTLDLTTNTKELLKKEYYQTSEIDGDIIWFDKLERNRNF